MTLQIAITGAAGQIGYSLMPQLAAYFQRRNQSIALRLLDLPQMASHLDGVAMEIADCNWPCIASIMTTTSPEEAFTGCDYALLVGAKPRGPGMERQDLLNANATIFSEQSRTIARVANPNAKVLVVGNPCNTNAWIAKACCIEKLDPKAFFAMTQLDEDRAIGLIANHLKCANTAVHNAIVWGNHSPTMYLDVDNITVDNAPLLSLVDHTWVNQSLLPMLRQRGKHIIDARGASSAMSAAAALAKMLDRIHYGSDGKAVSMVVPSQGHYGIPHGLMCSVPCIMEPNGHYRIVDTVTLSAQAQSALAASVAEMQTEVDAVAGLL